MQSSRGRCFASMAVTLSLWTCVKCSQEGSTAEVSSWPNPYYNNYDVQGPVEPAADQRQDVAAIAPAVFQFLVAAAMSGAVFLISTAQTNELNDEIQNLKTTNEVLKARLDAAIAQAAARQLSPGNQLDTLVNQQKALTTQCNKINQILDVAELPTDAITGGVNNQVKEKIAALEAKVNEIVNIENLSNC